jgi:hypothetical protein
MKSKLQKELFDIFKDDLSQLANPEALQRIENVCNYLPSIKLAAIEFRLNDGDKTDFHVKIQHDHDISAIVLFFEEQKLQENPQWQSIIEFLKKWNIHQHPYHQFISEVYLEYDLSQHDNPKQVPSIFVKMTNGASTDDEVMALTKQLLIDFKGENYYSYFKNILHKICFDLKNQALIGCFALMMSRPDEILRINVYNIKTKDIVPYLNKLGWQGKQNALEKSIDLVKNYFDDLILSFDIYKGMLLPTIGIEMFFENQPNNEPRWGFVLNGLESTNNCSKKHKQAILNWNKIYTPKSKKSWPIELILDSFENNRFSFSVIKQKASHLKWVIPQTGDPIIKAYLGYGSIFQNKETPLSKELAQKKNSQSALQDGLRFLLKKQTFSGYWKDYEVYKGKSDQWTTAYIACMIKDIEDPTAQQAVNNAWQILKDNYREDKGWGYNFYTPCDGDSTSWALFLAKKIDSIFFAAHKDIVFRYFKKNEGITTYVDKDEILNYVFLPADFITEGWNYGHNCITGVTAQFQKNTLNQIIAKRQEREGYWKGYWWKDVTYATYYCLQALLNEKELYHNEISLTTNWWDIEYGNWIKKTNWHHSTNLFYTSLLAEIGIILQKSKEKIKPLADHIIHQQNEKGAWKGDALLIVPMPNDTEQIDRGNWNRIDTLGLFTTATILRFLSNYNKYKVHEIK